MESQSKRQCMDPVSLYIDACQRESVYEMEACFNALVCDDDAIDLTDIMGSEEEAERLGLMMQTLSDKNHFVLCRFFCMAEALGKRITYEDARAMNNACATIRHIARVAPLEKYNYILLGVWLLHYFGFEM